MAPEAVPQLSRILISGIRITNVSDPTLQEALLGIDPEFNLSHLINNSLQEAPHDILLTAATFTDPSIAHSFVTKCLTHAKVEDRENADNIHFYLDPCGLSGSLNHVPSYVSFKIEACSRANNGAFESFQSRVSPHPLAYFVLFSNQNSASNQLCPCNQVFALNQTFAFHQFSALHHNFVLNQASQANRISACNQTSAFDQLPAVYYIAALNQLSQPNQLCAFNLVSAQAFDHFSVFCSIAGPNQFFQANQVSALNQFFAYDQINFNHFCALSQISALSHLFSSNQIFIVSRILTTNYCLYNFSHISISSLLLAMSVFLPSIRNQVLKYCLPSSSQDAQVKLALVDTLELLDINPNILDMTDTKTFKDNPKTSPSSSSLLWKLLAPFSTALPCEPILRCPLMGSRPPLLRLLFPVSL